MPIPVFDTCLDERDFEKMMRNARSAADFLKALAHEGRLLMLCHLASGEKSVTQLEELLSARQAAVSQQLARLRYEGLVETRRDGKTIYYRLAEGPTREILEVVYDNFCGVDASAG